MSDTSSGTTSNYTPLSPEAQAVALWAFINAKTPRFTLEAAVELINGLNLQQGEGHNLLAKRLRKALHARGIALKHTSALQAVARVSGYSSWHTDDGASTPRLRFAFLDTDKFDTDKSQKSEFSSWRELATELCSWGDKLYARGQLPLGILMLEFNGRALSFTTPVSKIGGQSDRINYEIWPLGKVTPLSEDDDWLMEAPAAIEKLRRRLEETGKAVVDGCAVLRLCADSHGRPGDVNAVTAADVSNSELVLIREDDEDDPQSGYEVARGDELTCWHQLELSLRSVETNVMPAVNVTIPVEGVGAWLVNGIRYVWALETIKPEEYVPGRVERLVGISDCERLLRRYKLAKRIHSNGFKYHAMNKRVEYLAEPPSTYRVDLHYLLHLLKDVGLTWESYLEKFEIAPLSMQAHLPTGFILKMLENLQVDKPNSIFAKPNLSEMVRVDDSGFLRSLMPRIDAVSYVRPKDLNDELAQDLKRAVDEFANALNLRTLVSVGSMPMEQELPYLVYANDAEEFWQSIEALGLSMYAAVVPRLFIIPEQVLPQTQGVQVWPWALAHALFVRFERVGGMR